jgi:hypothetical protein
MCFGVKNSLLNLSKHFRYTLYSITFTERVLAISV